ncbi:MAG TPA: hypothetical protein VF319_05820 [Caldimonas sp.]
MNVVIATLCLVSLAGVAACAAPAGPREVPVESRDVAIEMRVLVKLVRPSTDGAAIARQASGAASVPVRYLSATSAEWHALALGCGSAPACDAALQRLRADAATFAAVERDERRRPATP